MFWKIDVPKMSKNIERLQIRAKSFERLKECFFGRVADPQSSTLLKGKLHYKYFSTDLFTLKATAYQGKLLQKEYEF